MDVSLDVDSRKIVSLKTLYKFRSFLSSEGRQRLQMVRRTKGKPLSLGINMLTHEGIVKRNKRKVSVLRRRHIRLAF